VGLQLAEGLQFEVAVERVSKEVVAEEGVVTTGALHMIRKMNELEVDHQGLEHLNDHRATMKGYLGATGMALALVEALESVVEVHLGLKRVQEEEEAGEVASRLGADVMMKMMMGGESPDGDEETRKEKMDLGVLVLRDDSTGVGVRIMIIMTTYPNGTFDAHILGSRGSIRLS